MAFTHYRTRGVFLGAEPRGEADEVFTLFTEEFGRIQVRGRAIRKITSKLRSGAGVFYYSEIGFIQGKQYKTLTDAILIDKFDIDYNIANAINSLTPKAEKDDEIWHLLMDALKIKNLKLKIISNHFIWKLFDVLGYKPQLYNCACCEKKLLPETFFFVPNEGGVVCWKCFGKNGFDNNTSCEISVNTVKVLRLFLKEPFDITGKIKLQKQEQDNLQNISDFYFNCLKQANNPQKI